MCDIIIISFLLRELKRERNLTVCKMPPLTQQISPVWQHHWGEKKEDGEKPKRREGNEGPAKKSRREREKLEVVQMNEWMDG